jgi:hypothetical protein
MAFTVDIHKAVFIEEDVFLLIGFSSRDRDVNVILCIMTSERQEYFHIQQQAIQLQNASEK